MALTSNLRTLLCHSLKICNVQVSSLASQWNRSCSTSNSLSSTETKKPFWDDSDWMNQNDSNSEAYSELDITKLKPFPEYRNVAIGQVWGPNAYERVWNEYFEKHSPPALVNEHDSNWKKFVEDNGFDPIEYFSSPDFKERYGERLLWEDYRRNYKGQRPNQRTRKSCFRKGEIYTGSPCPICRDDKLLIHYNNLVLLNHFIDSYSGSIHHHLRTGVCLIKQKLLEKTVWLARDLGLLPKPMPPAHKQNLDSYRVDHLAVRPSS